MGLKSLRSLSERSSAVGLLSSSEWQSTAEEPAEQEHTRQPLHKVAIGPETRQLCQTASLAGRLPTSQLPVGRTVARKYLSPETDSAFIQIIILISDGYYDDVGLHVLGCRD